MTTATQILQKCQKLAKIGNVNALIPLLDQAVLDHPNSADLWSLRAKTMLQLGRIDDARHNLEQTVALNPFDGEAFDHLGVIEQKAGDYLRASQLHLSALNSQPNHPGFLFNLAVALEHLDQGDKAFNIYQGILQLDPDHTKTMVNLATHYEAQNDIDEALSLFAKALDKDPNNFAVHMGLGNLYRKIDNLDQAKTHYEKALALKPDHGAAQFMLANVTGQTPDHAPSHYVATLFDDFAKDFDHKLLNDLEYRAPDLLYKAIRDDLKILKTDHNSLKAIDLGAGTGLFGQLIRNDVTLSIGVDLSQKMLQKAQNKKIYDDIICDDIVNALQEQNDHTCHMVTAVDVFVYVGALDKVFQHTKRVLHPQGLFAFTTELLDETQNDHFKLLDTARYAHHPRYIEKLAQQTGFKIMRADQTWLRKNKTTPINGMIYVLKKKENGSNA